MAEIRSDEVSLLDLWRILVVQKKTIAVVWIVFTLLGVGYAFLATPIYKTEVFMLPPSEKSVQPLNIQISSGVSGASGVSGVSGASGLRTEYKPTQVYAKFLQALRSRAGRRAFYEKHHVAESLGLSDEDDLEMVFEKRFNRLLVVNQNAKKKELEGFFSLSFEGKDAALITQWVNLFVEETGQSVSQGLIDDVESKVESFQQNTEELIQSKKSLAAARRQDRIVALEEALRIALSMSQGDQDVKSKVRLGDIAVNTNQLPLYMLSPNALKAEISVLKSRQDDAPFIGDLRDLEEKLARLNQIHIETKDIQVMTWDQKAVVPTEPEKPNEILILILAMLIGLIGGVLVAFVRNAISTVSMKLSPVT